MVNQRSRNILIDFDNQANPTLNHSEVKVAESKLQDLRRKIGAGLREYSFESPSDSNFDFICDLTEKAVTLRLRNNPPRIEAIQTNNFRADPLKREILDLRWDRGQQCWVGPAPAPDAESQLPIDALQTALSGILPLLAER